MLSTVTVVAMAITAALARPVSGWNVPSKLGPYDGGGTPVGGGGQTGPCVGFGWLLYSISVAIVHRIVSRIDASIEVYWVGMNLSVGPTPPRGAMSFEDAVGYTRGRLRFGVKLGNDRFLALLARLGNPQNAFRPVHIAGTKGKGSTAVMTASILRAAGYRTGTYLSPYVYDVRERIQIDGEMIPRDDFARWVETIKPHVEALEQTELGATTEFELKTAIGFCYFAEQKVDYAVVEVGLGGRLDATNVFSAPLVTAITTIGYDHVELLGPTLADIAREKAGIVKPGVPCVTAVLAGSEADGSISTICAERGALLIRVTEENVTPPLSL